VYPFVLITSMLHGNVSTLPKDVYHMVHCTYGLGDYKRKFVFVKIRPKDLGDFPHSSFPLMHFTPKKGKESGRHPSMASRMSTCPLSKLMQVWFDSPKESTLSFVSTLFIFFVQDKASQSCY